MSGVSLHEVLVFGMFANQSNTWLTAAEASSQLQQEMSSRSCRHQIKRLSDMGVLIRKWIAPEYFYQLNQKAPDCVREKIDAICEALTVLDTRRRAAVEKQQGGSR